jgi:MoaA/NifB/PqqE/SkfB family radical SAM enzyme
MSLDSSANPANATGAGGKPISWREWLQYGPFLAQVVVTRRCNLTCAYCYEYDKTSQPVPFEALEARLRKLRQLRAWVVCFIGGEPTLHPELPRLVERARALGFPRRQLITNGLRLTPESIEALNDAGLTDMQMSVDGVHRNASTEKVLDVLGSRLELLARRARFKVTLSAVIGSAPPEEVLAVVDFARAQGFRPRVLLLHDEGGRVKLSRDELRLYRRVKHRLGADGRDGADYRDRLIHDGIAPFRCRGGSRYLYVDEHGIVRWCSQTAQWFSKELLSYSLDDLRRQFYSVKECNSTCSIGCARTASAYDEWRAQPRTTPVEIGEPAPQVAELDSGRLAR